MTEKPISPLRQRMIEDMTGRHFAEKAQTHYIRYVKNSRPSSGARPIPPAPRTFVCFNSMTKTHVSPGVINATVVALRFFFKVTLERDDLVRRLMLDTEPRRAPIVLSPEEVARLLTAAPGVSCLVDAIHARPSRKSGGDGDTSSSDGQFLRAGGHGEARADYNGKYGSEPGVKLPDR